MKAKWIVAILTTVALVFGQAGLSLPSVYADTGDTLFKPPEVNGIVEVSNPAQLAYISLNQAQYLQKNIKLMNNINLGGYLWTPIANFAGTFDGNNNEISNLNVSKSVFVVGYDTASGMFARTSQFSRIINLTLINFNVTGTAAYMGTLAGINNGEIKNVGIIGGVVQQTGTTFAMVGGLVGNNDGFIHNSFSTCNVSASSGDVGGLVGLNVSGMNHSNISNAYATGAVKGNTSSSVGGVDGLSTGGAGVYASYWNVDTTGVPASNNQNTEKHGVTTTDMLKESTFNGWDFDNTWSILPGKTYPFLKEMNSLSTLVLPQAVRYSNYAQMLQLPTPSTPPNDLTWQAISLPAGLSLLSDGTLNGTPTTPGLQYVTAVAYSPSTHVVYGSGTILLMVKDQVIIDTDAPREDQISIINNPAPTPDTVAVSRLNASDVIKIYDSPTDGNLLGTATVATGQTSATVSIAQLGTGAGQVYVSVTSTGKTESPRTAASFGAEQVPSTAPLASNITVTNNNLVNVNGLTGGDTVKVYDSATGGNMLGTYTLSAAETFASIFVGDLGTGEVQIYVTVTSTGKTESTRTVVTFGSGADTTGPVTRYHFDEINGKSNGHTFIKGFKVSLQATDIGSGVKNTQYQINGGAWNTYVNPFTINAGTTKTVEYYSTDNEGNEEKTHNLMNFDTGRFIGAGKY
jgi:hypothetical protein